MADAHKPFGQNMHQEPPDEFGSFQPLGLYAPLIPVILVPERDPVTFHRQQAPVTDGDSVRVSSEIIDDRLRLVQAVSGVDHPLLLHQAVEYAINFSTIGHAVQFTGGHRHSQQRHHSPAKTP